MYKQQKGKNPPGTYKYLRHYLHTTSTTSYRGLHP